MSTIVDALWGDAPPPRAVNVVHSHVGALRRLVEPHLPRRAQGSWLLSSSSGYRAVVDSDNLDLLAFRSTVRQAKEVEPARRLELLCSALQLWRGRAAQDAILEDRGIALLVALDRERTQAAVLAAELGLELQTCDAVITPLHQVAEENPTDERVQALLMRCLASTGQRADALAGFQRVRSYLVEELGVSPGEHLDSAHQDVLREDLPSEAPAALPPPAQLPAQFPEFVGRQDELDQLRDLEGAGARTIVISGMAGVGKTMLAVRKCHEVAHQFPDGQFYVDLQGYSKERSPLDPSKVLASFLSALDVPASKIPPDPASRGALFRTVLAHRRVLILLDNARNTAQVSSLIPGTIGSTVIITSRSQLRGLVKNGAYSIALAPLSLGEIEEYVSNRLAISSNSRLHELSESLLQLSGGLPLALSLLAARLSHHSGKSLDREIRSLLAKGPLLDMYRDPSDPTTDLRLVFSWSCEALPATPRRLFELLAVAPGREVSAGLAAALLNVSEATAKSALEALVEQNLATAEVGDKYSRHDLLEEYALSRLRRDSSIDVPTARARATQHLSCKSLHAAREISPYRMQLPEDLGCRASHSCAKFHDIQAAASWLRDEQGTLLHLLSAIDTDQTLTIESWQLAWALQHQLDRSGAWSELLATQHSAAASARKAGRKDVESLFNLGAAKAYVNLGDLDAATSLIHAEVATVTSESPAELARLAECHRQLYQVDKRKGNLEEALAHAVSATELYSTLSHPLRAVTLNSVGFFEAQLGHYDDALKHCTEAVALLRNYGELAANSPKGIAPGHQYAMAEAVRTLGLVHLRRSGARAALAYYAEAFRLYQAAGIKFGTGDVAFALGDLLTRLERREVGDALMDFGRQTLTDLGFNDPRVQ